MYGRNAFIAPANDQSGSPPAERASDPQDDLWRMLGDRPGLEVVRGWVAGLSQGAIVPWEGGVVSLLPASPAARAAVLIEGRRGQGACELVHDPADPPCDLVLGPASLAGE